MGKCVIISQDSLIAMKENLATLNENVEADKFYLGQESDNPPVGGNYAHIEEESEEPTESNTFERWYGNSILKDENGMPLKMYHGTSEDFNTFDKKFIGKSGAYEGYGFNFTPFKSRAMGYNPKNVIEAYLKVENPMTSKTHKITLRQLMSIISELDKGKPFTDTIVAAYEPARYNEKWDAAYYKRALPTAARAIYDYNKECGYGDAGLYAELCLNGQADTLETINTFEKMGYDAAIFYDNEDRINTVVVFEPNQIKRTTNKTFNPNSDIMDEDNAINEGYCGSKLKYIDLSDVGLVNYEWYFDEDEYNEWLADNELADSEETRHGYYVNEVTYGVEYCDNYSQHTMDVDENVSYSDLEELFGENMAEKILSNCIKYGKGSFETFEMYEDSDYDVNNPQELNDIAMKMFSHGEYYKDCRGFILSNGVVIYTPSEHNEITILNNVNDKSDFISMGNIRVLPNSINIYTEPTYEQELVLRDVIESYSDDELFLDICNKDDCCGVRYDHPNWRYVLGEIERYYSEGIRPQGNQYFESREKRGIMLNESQESKSIAQAKRLVMQKLNYNEQEADEFIRIRLRNDVPTLRTPQGGKFILGVTRMFCDGELRTANDISNLNSTLKLVASDAHINEYDRNLNGLSFNDLIQRFAKTMSDNLEAEKAEVGKMQFNGSSDYQIVRIDSFKQASQYGEYTSWCVTHQKNMFDSYTSNGINQFYFCLKNGFENVKAKPSEGCPLDEYGLSMIAVSVNENGMLNTCTCRWNHDNGGNDSIMNTKQISEVIGMNFFEVFKPNGKWSELIANVKQRLINGEDFDEVFDGCANFYGGLAKVELNRKWNFINKNGEFLSEQWLDYCYDFHEGFALVKLNNKYNFINKNGEFLSEQWFDYCCNFKKGFAMVELNNKWNFINNNGELLSNQWFDNCCNFDEGFAAVRLNNKWNFIDKNGKLISRQWFDDCGDFKEGFAAVELNNKCNFINKSGELLSEQWFDDCKDFKEGFARIRLDGRYYCIDKNGKIKSNESKMSRKNILVSEDQLKAIKENFDFEVNSSEIDLSSFKKKDELVPSIWKDGLLDSRIRLKLLDIADDFWDFVNIKWVRPNGIILTGSICNFNWSSFSDIDLHLIVDFSEIDERSDFVRDYLDSKKNEWNNEHEGLNIMGFNVELYVQDFGEMPKSGGIYDLEENDWIKKPSKDEIKPIGLNKFSIKDKAAQIMTIIDNMYDALVSTDDSHEIEEIGNDAKMLWKKVKEMRKSSLERDGEMGSGNVVYKYIRRQGYLDKLWNLRTLCYDKSNSITESKKNSKKYTVYVNGKKEESKFGNKEIIREYLEKNNNLPLYKYYKWAKTASSCEKARDLAYSCCYYIDEYIKSIYYRYSEFENLLDDDKFNYVDEEKIETFCKLLEENNLCDHFISIMQDIVNRIGLYNELPSWCYMDFNRIVKNEWCIHFTKDAGNIVKYGFTGGTEDIDHLAYTDAGQEKPSAGYNFAFLINDRNVDYNEYGDEAVIFRTSGVEIYHYGDNENQVIFWGPNVKNFIPIHQENGEWVVYGQNGQVLVRKDEPSKIAIWATENLPQYRKQIMTGKNGYIPKHWVYDKESGKMKVVSYPIYRNESIKKYIKLLKENLINEETVADGSSEGNPYSKRWKAEREALKTFISNYGRLMQSKEDDKGGKLYKVFWDKNISQLIGYNYALCVQWDEQQLKPKSTVYIRALDKFTPFIRQNIQYDTRGNDNEIGTADDMNYRNIR